jgi:hypothetical protein
MRRRLVMLALVAALAGCDTVDLGTPPADVNVCMPGQMWFVDQIWPNFLGQEYNGKHCYDSDCHGGAASGMKLVNPIEPGTFPLPADWAANYRQAANEMNCSDVLDSKLLLLPENVQVHGGGQLILKGGMEETLVEQWIMNP